MLGSHSRPPAFTTDDKDAATQRFVLFRIPPIALFLAVIAVLAAIGVAAFVTPRRVVAGLPRDPDVERAIAALAGRFHVPTEGLRFSSALAGEQAPAGAQDMALTHPAARAAERRHLLAARRRHPWDARLGGALAHLELAGGRFASAERGYRTALLVAPGYGEARLGLGLALTLLASTGGDERSARARRLEAIAHFAAVDPRDPVYAAALYDRVMLLVLVGRDAEARRWARVYLERPDGEWSRRMRALAAAPPAEPA